MAGYLTTHVLDTSRGQPAAGMRIALYRVAGNSHKKIADAVTNADGRTDTPILPEENFRTGSFELIFFASDYLEETAFLGDIPIRFNMTEEAHYHVPLLLSPYGYSTYRGS